MDQKSPAHPYRAVGRHGLLRDMNYRAVYESLATEGASSRTDLARRLRLSAAAVGRVVEGLLRADLVREGERIGTGVGRPQTLIHVRSDAGLVAGMSIRSSSMRLYLADLDGTVHAKQRVDRTNAGPDALARQVRDLLLTARDGVSATVPIASVVVGISGVWNSRDRKVYAAPNLSLLEGLDVQSLFLDALAEDVLPDSVVIDNDVNLAALGEGEHGAARGVNDFFYLSLGSGVGGAAVVAGSLYRGLAGFAGEIGYLPISHGGRLHTLEALVSRPAVQAFARRADLPPPTDEAFGGPKDGPLARYLADVLGEALVSVVTTMNPELIVFGGGLGRHGDAWIAGTRDRLAAFLPVVPALVSTELGREASLLGAVSLGRVLARRALLTRELAA